MNRTVLVIDDEQSMLSLLRDELGHHGYGVTTHTSPEAALSSLAKDDFGVVLCDVRMQAMSGLDLCREMVALRGDVPIIVITGFGTVEHAIGAMRAGAFDFVTKPFRTDDLVATIERALARRAMTEQVTRLSDDGAPVATGEMIGECAAMQTLYGVVARVAAVDVTVLVTGESGTGKELVARALHASSGRRGGPFLAISCAAMPEALLESELFGHEKGAFTDAVAAKRGMLFSASGGTLMLDEVGEMPWGIQAKLLRALQEKTARAVGASKETPFDTRIIAATNRDLEDDVASGRFREDLFYRLNVVNVHLPPLREREDDVLLLAHTFLQRYSPKGRVIGLTTAAAERLLAYSWPGNVRELQNCIERAVAFSRSDMLQVGDLPERIISHERPVTRSTTAADPIVSLDEVERRHVTQVLHAVGGNKAYAARALGLDRRTLYRKLQRWRSAPIPSTRGPG